MGATGRTPRRRCGPHLMGKMGHKPQSARRGHHIGAAEGLTAPAAAPHVMAVSGGCSGGRGVCGTIGHVGCDWHAVNDTMLAHGQLLVDDPERIGRSRRPGCWMDQTPFNREYRTQQWATTFDSPETRRAAKFTTTPIRPRTGTEP